MRESSESLLQISLKLYTSAKIREENAIKMGEGDHPVNRGYNESWQLVDLYTYKDLRITGFPDHVPTSSSPKCTDPENYVANALGLVPFITYFRTREEVARRTQYQFALTTPNTGFFFWKLLETKVISKLCSVLCKKF